MKTNHWSPPKSREACDTKWISGFGKKEEQQRGSQALIWITQRPRTFSATISNLHSHMSLVAQALSHESIFFFHFQSARVNHSNQVPARSEVWFYAWDLYQRSELENYTQSRSFVFFSETHLAFCSFFLTLGKTGAAPQMLFCLLLSTRLNREQYNPVFSQLTRCISKPRLPRFPSKDGKTII